MRGEIVNIVSIKKNLLVLEELYRGEKGRTDSSVLLKLAGSIRKNRNLTEEYEKLVGLKDELSRKIILLAERIAKEGIYHQMPRGTGNIGAHSTGIIELRCPKCNAQLPFPDSLTVKCKYCGSTFIVGDIFPQIDAMIKVL